MLYDRMFIQILFCDNKRQIKQVTRSLGVVCRLSAVSNKFSDNDKPIYHFLALKVKKRKTRKKKNLADHHRSPSFAI